MSTKLRILCDMLATGTLVFWMAQNFLKRCFNWRVCCWDIWKMACPEDDIVYMEVTTPPFHVGRDTWIVPAQVLSAIDMKGDALFPEPFEKNTKYRLRLEEILTTEIIHTLKKWRLVYIYKNNLITNCTWQGMNQ